MTPHALERRFVYYPDKNVAATPSSVGLTYRDLSLETTDHVKLHGWYVPHPSSTVTLLIFHGNAGNMGDRVPWMEMLHETGAGILIIDYRGYGNSEGDPHEEGLYRDAQTAHEWWRKERGHAGEKLVLVGESIGGAVAVVAGLRPLTIRAEDEAGPAALMPSRVMRSDPAAGQYDRRRTL